MRVAARELREVEEAQLHQAEQYEIQQRDRADNLVMLEAAVQRRGPALPPRRQMLCEAAEWRAVMVDELHLMRERLEHEVGPPPENTSAPVLGVGIWA